MIQLRIGEQEHRFPEDRWEAWVSEGRVPPDALVFSLRFTGGLWKRADTLPLYDFFRRAGEEERREAHLDPDAPAPFAELPAVAFPRRGVSGTEILLILNLTVALIVAFFWREDLSHLFGDGGFAWRMYDALHDRHNPIGLVLTMFIHADFRHLMANMLTLAAGAAFVEYLFGGRLYVIYLVGGLAAGIVSYLGKGHGPMSVGASGAIYACIGAVAGFVLRAYRGLPRWHRWKARRIYAPLLAIAVLPSIFHADLRAHVGGFVCGVLLGLLLPPGSRGRRLSLQAPARDRVPSGTPPPSS